MGNVETPLHTPPRATRTLVAAMLLALIHLAIVDRYGPPEPRPNDAPAREYSATRGAKLRAELLAEDIPHPTGSEANFRVRDRLIAILKRMGYSPTIQTAFACGEHGSCDTVQNVLVRIPGTRPTGTLLLCAHYDSQRAAPGASDDGIGLGTLLEIARALKELGGQPNTILLLFTDGEEEGLLGAEAFVRQHPLAKEVKAVLNFDARGTTGPSLMFETSPGNGDLIRLFARAVPRPITSSLFYSIYKLLPNDSDMTVFKRAGYRGLNFALVGSVQWYHTPLDDLAHASPRSLQHHGENGLGMMRALACADLKEPAEADAVFFDLLSSVVVQWPESWARPLSLVVLALMAGLTRVFLARGAVTGRKMGWGVVAGAASLAAAVGTGLLVRKGMAAAGVLPGQWTAHPYYALGILWAVGLAACFATLTSFANRTNYWSMWCVYWTAVAAVGVLEAALLPGAAYISTVPAGVAFLTGLLACRGETHLASWATLLIPITACALLWGPANLLLVDALGYAYAFLYPAIAGTIGIQLAMPLLSPGSRGTRAFPAVLLVAAVVLVGLDAQLAPYTPALPQGATVTVVSDQDTHKTHWMVQTAGIPLPEEMARLGTFALSPPTYPWVPVRFPVYLAEVPNDPGDSLRLEILEKKPTASGRHVRLRIDVGPNAARAGLALPRDATVTDLKIQGAPGPELGRVQRTVLPWQVYYCPPVSGHLDVEFNLVGTAPARVCVMEWRPGLPPAAAGLTRVRPPSAVPVATGDAQMRFLCREL
jgi:hypothetical protein